MGGVTESGKAEVICKYSAKQVHTRIRDNIMFTYIKFARRTVVDDARQDVMAR